MTTDPEQETLILDAIDRFMKTEVRPHVKRLEQAEVVDPAQRGECEQVFFGATVTVCDSSGCESAYCIVGVDEADAGNGLISWVSPLARALLKLREGEMATLRTPSGIQELEILSVSYGGPV